MVRYIAYLLFPLLMLSVSSVNATHTKWHVLHAEPDTYCVDLTVCKGNRCKRKAKRYAAKNGLPNCLAGGTKTGTKTYITANWLILYAEPDSYCVDPTICKGKRCKRKAKRYAARNGLPNCSEIEEPQQEEPQTQQAGLQQEPQPLEDVPDGTTSGECTIPAGNFSGDKPTYTIIVNDKSYEIELTPPSENIDGSQVNNIAKYVVYLGGTPNTNNFSLKADLNTLGSTIFKISPVGIYYFSIVAVDSDGYESGFSNCIVLN
jgi:hypothetical protein